MEKVKLQTEIIKIILDVEKAGRLGLKQQWKRTNRGQNWHENYCVQNSTKSMEKFKSPTGILKINLDVENAGGLRIRKKLKRTDRGKIYIKFNVSRIPPNQGKRWSHQYGF